MIKYEHNHSSNQLDFTGERMMPKLNRGFTFYYEHLLRYLFVSQFVKDKKVLDLGCGVGYGCEIISSYGPSKIVGIDNLKESIEYAKKNYPGSMIDYEVGDAQSLKTFRSTFNVVIAFEIIEHLIKQKDFLQGIKKNLEKEGIVCISTSNKETYPADNHFHVKELTLKQFKELLEKNFKYVYLFNQQFAFSNTLFPLETTKKSTKILQEDLIEQEQLAFLPKIANKNSRYIIAICADVPIVNSKMYSLATLKVDNFSLLEGVEGMTKAEQELIQAAIEDKQLELDQLRARLRKHGFYKLYSLWKTFEKTNELTKEGTSK